MYILNSSTKETLFRFLDLIQPELEHDGKIEAIRRGWEALRLHDLPMFFGLFVFDAALRDVKAAIKLKQVALERKHWFPLLKERMELLGTDGLLNIMRFIAPMEEQSHKGGKDGKNSEGNEKSGNKSFIVGRGNQSYL